LAPVNNTSLQSNAVMLLLESLTTGFHTFWRNFFHMPLLQCVDSPLGYTATE
jgi:hypothetical protein